MNVERHAGSTQKPLSRCDIAGRKLFGIGLSRTGTTSLSTALALLGYRTYHFPRFVLRNSSPIVEFRAAMNRVARYLSGSRATLFDDVVAGLEGRNKLELKTERIEEYDALVDTPVARFYRKLDGLYPKSRFIYTTRDLDAWLMSCERLFHPGYMRGERFVQLTYDLYGTNKFDAGLFTEAYYRHEEGIHEHFSDRPNDLLTMNICSGDGWEVLCRFLDVECPDVPFPRENVSKQ